MLFLTRIFKYIGKYLSMSMLVLIMGTFLFGGYESLNGTKNSIFSEVYADNHEEGNTGEEPSSGETEATAGNEENAGASETEEKSSAAPNQTTSVQESFGEIIVLIIHGVVYITWIIIAIIGDLLSNDIVMHPNVVPLLKLLWTIIRNLLNTAAVFWMLYIAFKTLFNFGDESNETVKQDLPKLALALVLVNFSWLFMTVVIDASTVAINYAFSLTDQVKGGYQANMICKEDGNEELCGLVPYSLKLNQPPTNKQQNSDAQAQDNPESIQIGNIFKTHYDDLSHEQQFKLNNLTWKGEGEGYVCGKNTDKTDKKCNAADFLKHKENTAWIHMKLKKFDESINFNNRSLVPIIAENLLPLEQLVTRSQNTKNLGTLIMTSLFSIVLALAMCIAFVALFLVLIVRVCALWIGLMLSPLLVLYFVEDDTLGIKEQFQKLVHLAFVPAIFGLVFSMTMIIVGQLGYQEVASLGFVNGAEVVFENGILESGHPFFLLLLSILVIVMFWMGIWWALSGAPVVGGIMETMQQGVETGAKWVAKRPLYLNWVPVANQSGTVTDRADLATILKGAQNKMREIGGEGDAADQRAQRVLSGEFTLSKEANDQIKAFRGNANEVKEFRQELVRAAGVNNINKFDINNESHADAYRQLRQQDKFKNLFTHVEGLDGEKAGLAHMRIIDNLKGESERNYDEAINKETARIVGDRVARGASSSDTSESLPKLRDIDNSTTITINNKPARFRSNQPSELQSLLKNKYGLALNDRIANNWVEELQKIKGGSKFKDITEILTYLGSDEAQTKKKEVKKAFTG